MLSKEQNDEECDATDDNSSNVAWLIKIITFKIFIKPLEGFGVYAIFLRPSLNNFPSSTPASSTTALLSLFNASRVLVGKIEMPL